MTPTIEMPATASNALAYEVPFPKDLPYEDKENMDTPWHRAQMELLINVIETNWKGRRFFCGGNMFIHFSAAQVRNRDFRGPDFFVVRDVDHNKRRLYWAVWEEGGRYPDVVIELLSPSTEDEDRTTKKDIYERIFHTNEYFLFDFLTAKIEGWRLGDKRKKYRALPTDQGRMWSKELEMSLGTWWGVSDGYEATWLRFFDRDGNLVPTGQEKEAMRAEKEAKRAYVEAERANTEAERANTEAARADAAEAEKELLLLELETLRHQHKPKES